MDKKNFEQWKGFKEGKWNSSIDLNNFILTNCTPYTGDESFLQPISDRTKKVKDRTDELFKQERAKGGVLDVDTERVSSLLSYPAGYVLSKDDPNEIIHGIQCEKPLQRSCNPFGGMRMVESACENYGYKVSDSIKENFKFKTTHNEGVFRVYTKQMRALRHYGIITGLPDAYGRGRIIGDYRRVALYGVDVLIDEKVNDYYATEDLDMTEEVIRNREELFRQVDFLRQLIAMAKEYGDDISKPAANAHEAVQWTYYAYLAAVKEQNGAAMSLGRVSTFLDIYIQRDLATGVIDEKGAQELIDQLILKLRIVKQLRTADYNELFAGDPTWVTESIGGMAQDGRTLVTKNSFRVLNTLYNLGSAPEPNLTVLWSEKLPTPFKRFCAKVSIDTSSIQYENDDIMRPIYGDDYGIACCVSAMKIGKQMQFFGARCNLAKVLLMSLNGGKDEKTGNQIAPESEPMNKGVLNYDKVIARYHTYLDWLAHQYADTMNVIHYMHDKYAYEKIQMALHDTDVHRFMSFGAAGISVAADSLSAIKYASVTPITDENGLIIDYKVEGEYPQYGNDDDRVDSIACELAHYFICALRKNQIYRNAEPTLSLLTITSNVMYGKKTGATPCGRKSGEPFAPGANPMHGRENHGALASLNSVAKLSYDDCRDGISNTFSIVPSTLAPDREGRVINLVNILDGYFKNKGHHLNINVYDKELLLKAHAHPEDYPDLTIRVSGYAVKFSLLSKEAREEVLNRTYFNAF